MYRDNSARKGEARRTAWLVAAMLLCAVAASAQLEVGDNLSMNLNGNLGFGYNGAFGNQELSSSHSNGLTGNADLTGYYFHPNFLSFQLRPYYDRNQSNTESQTVTRGTGVGGSVSLFGGSHFPGSVSFGKDFSTNSEFRLAGVPTVAGDSSGQTFAITWSALVSKLPQVSASYSAGSSESSFFESERAKSSSRNLNLNSGYQIAGFDLRGNFSHITNNFTTPAFLTSEMLTSGGSGTMYGVSAQHRLPLRGSLGLGWSHAEYSGDNGNDWSSNSYNAGTSFTPWRRLSLYQSASYTTDLTAAFGQSILNGAEASNLRSDKESSGLFYSAGASFLVGHGVTINGHFNHRVQWLIGNRYEDTQYGGAINYNLTSRLFGFLYFGLGVVDTASKLGNEGGGFNAIVGMNRKFGHWDTSADFSYAHNVQTLVAFATTSSYSYGFSTRRKISEDLRWSGAFRGSHSGLVTQEGDGNRAESFSSGLSWRRYGFSGSYSQSSGTAVFTTSGELTATPLGSLITEDFLLFNARSFGVNASTRLFRRVSVSGGFSRFSTSTVRGGGGTHNTGDRYSVRTEYKLRKFSLIGGFNRSMQEVSALPGGPRIVNSYYLSLSRWFNVF